MGAGGKGQAAPKPGRTRHAGPRVVVVGAGAFGGWTALTLQRKGSRVTLLDAWGPANDRASSSGETRIIRAIYGEDARYVQMASRALALWRENERRFKSTLLHPTGVLWLAGDDDAYIRQSLPHLEAAGWPFEEIAPAAARRRWPQMRFDGARRVVLEREAGILFARQACREVLAAFVAQGGDYRQAEARPIGGGSAPAGDRGFDGAAGLKGLALADGSVLQADRYVIACGPWLGTFLPSLASSWIRTTRQEVFVFGTPGGDARFLEAALPVWIDLGPPLVYGIPAGLGRGFKVADDTRGALFDPTTGDRAPGARGIAAARGILARRFPDLARAPLLEATVCQYENSPDGRFLIDRHPTAENLFIVGGGSGHGFKHGPVIGEMAAALVLGERAADPFFALSRLGGLGGIRTR